MFHPQYKKSLAYRLFCAFICASFLLSAIIPPPTAFAQSLPAPGMFSLPAPGTMVALSPGFTPALIKGITPNPTNPLEFDFIVDTGDENLEGEALRVEASRLIKYFLASLTVPEDELWVNLSPYEKGRIVPESFGVTEMGRDLLSQDYLLKQLTASLIYPEDDLGKEFWKRVHKKAFEKFGTTDIPMNTFNKVWIVPDKAVVLEHQGSAYIVASHLKVMLEEDYLAISHQTSDISLQSTHENLTTDDRRLMTQIMREIVLPEIEKEINEGKTFAGLRQIYNAVILATWYKETLKESILSKVYVDQNKTKGVDTDDPQAKQKIYEQYLQAFQKGVYDFIKEDYDPATQEIIPRKYFSGGAKIVPEITPIGVEELTPADAAQLAHGSIHSITVGLLGVRPDLTEYEALRAGPYIQLDNAMTVQATADENLRTAPYVTLVAEHERMGREVRELSGRLTRLQRDISTVDKESEREDWDRLQRQIDGILMSLREAQRRHDRLGIALDGRVNISQARDVLYPLFRHINGQKGVPIVHTLAQQGIFDSRFGQPGSSRFVSIKEVVQGREENLAYIYGAFENMAHLGLVRMKPAYEDTQVALTDLGWLMVELAKVGYLETFDGAIANALEYHDYFRRGPPIRKGDDVHKAYDEFIELVDKVERYTRVIERLKKKNYSEYSEIFNILASELDQQDLEMVKIVLPKLSSQLPMPVLQRGLIHIHSYFIGMLMSPVMVSLGMPFFNIENRIISKIGPSILELFDENGYLFFDRLPAQFNKGFIYEAFRLLHAQGLVKADKQLVSLTDKGRAFFDKVTSYGVTDAYSLIDAHLEDFLFGDPNRLNLNSDEHMGRFGRVKDIWGSSGAHHAYMGEFDEETGEITKDGILTFVRDLYHNTPLNKQSVGFFNMGSGDAQLARDVTRYILKYTDRGKNLKTHPLVVVVSDFNEAALGRERDTMAEFDGIEGLHVIVMWADVTDPEDFNEDLKARLDAIGLSGYDKDDFVHTEEFIPHERRLKIKDRDQAREIIRRAVQSVDRSRLTAALLKLGIKENDIPSDEEMLTQLVISQFEGSYSDDEPQGRLLPGYVVAADFINFLRRWIEKEPGRPNYHMRLLELHKPRANQLVEEVPNDINQPMALEQTLAPAYQGTHWPGQYILPYEEYHLAVVLAGLKTTREPMLWPNKRGLPIGVSLSAFVPEDSAMLAGTEAFEGDEHPPIYFVGNYGADIDRQLPKGNVKMKMVLGGKGANLAEMAHDDARAFLEWQKAHADDPAWLARFGITREDVLAGKYPISVPLAGTVATEQTLHFEEGETGKLSSELVERIKQLVRVQAQSMGTVWGARKGEGIPHLVSVRSGAPESMPGMMETVLNLGLNDETVEALVEATNERSAWGSYARAIEMYGQTVLGIEEEVDNSPVNFKLVKERMLEREGVSNQSRLSVEAQKELIRTFKQILADRGLEFPQDIDEQVVGAVVAVMRSSNNERAIVYRANQDPPLTAEQGRSAVTIQSMVLGNLNDYSGTGVAHTRDMGDGTKEFNIDFAFNAQGEAVVDGSLGKEEILNFDRLMERLLEVAKHIRLIGAYLEENRRDVQDMEFTVVYDEATGKSKVWMLQTRNAKRTAKAAVVTAVDMVKEGLISEQEAVKRVNAKSVQALLVPRFDPDDLERAEKEGRLLSSTGLPAGPGQESGVIALSSKKAEIMNAQGRDVILVRPQTSPEDLSGMLAAKAVYTAKGGMASHAAVVARGFNKTTIVGDPNLAINEETITITKEDGSTEVLREGVDILSIDVSQTKTGMVARVFKGAIKTVPSTIVTAQHIEMIPEVELGGEHFNDLGRAMDPDFDSYWEYVELERFVKLHEEDERESLRIQAAEAKDHLARWKQNKQDQLGVFNSRQAYEYAKKIQEFTDFIEKAQKKQLSEQDWEFYGKYKTLMGWADKYRHENNGVNILANTDTALGMAEAVMFGAEGIGLTRTEHMFAADDRPLLFLQMLFAKDPARREAALKTLQAVQKADFIGIFFFSGKDGVTRPATIRLLDPPLNEFLPKLDEEEKIAKLAVLLGWTPQEVIDEIKRLNDANENPMFSFRGARLPVVYPDILTMQNNAMFDAMSNVQTTGRPVKLKIMVPLIGNAKEMEWFRVRIEEMIAARDDINREDILIGAMIETPAAAMNSDEIARVSDFDSFGTNDIAQTVIGISRDDSGPYLSNAVAAGIYRADPYQTVVEGMEPYMYRTIMDGKGANALLDCSGCGEQMVDVDSLRETLVPIGVDSVSGSPPRLPLARLAAVQLALDPPKVKRIRELKEKLDARKPVVINKKKFERIVEIAEQTSLGAQYKEAIFYLERQGFTPENIAKVIANLNLSLPRGDVDPKEEAELASLVKELDADVLDVAVKTPVDDIDRQHRFDGAGIGLITTEEYFSSDESVRSLIQEYLLRLKGTRNEEVEDQLLLRIREIIARDFEGRFSKDIQHQGSIAVRLPNIALEHAFEYEDEQAFEQRVSELMSALGVSRNEVLGYINKYEEENPAIGQRAARLFFGPVAPLMIAIAQGIVEGASSIGGSGVHVNLVIPLVPNAKEIQIIRRGFKDIKNGIFIPSLEQALEQYDVNVRFSATIESPYAITTAGEIARETGLVFIHPMRLTEKGLAAFAADARKAFLARYIEEGLWESDPYDFAPTSTREMIAEAVRDIKSQNLGNQVAIIVNNPNDIQLIELAHALGIDTLVVPAQDVYLATIAAAQAAVTVAPDAAMLSDDIYAKLSDRLQPESFDELTATVLDDAVGDLGAWVLLEESSIERIQELARTRLSEFGGFDDDGRGLIVQGRLVRSKGPTVQQASRQSIEIASSSSPRFRLALMDKFKEELTEAKVALAAKNQEQFEIHLSNLLEAIRTAKRLLEVDGSKVQQATQKAVLVINPDLNIRSHIALILQGKGYEVVVASDSDDADRARATFGEDHFDETIRTLEAADAMAPADAAMIVVSLEENDSYIVQPKWQIPIIVEAWDPQATKQRTFQIEFLFGGNFKVTEALQWEKPEIMDRDRKGELYYFSADGKLILSMRRMGNQLKITNQNVKIVSIKEPKVRPSVTSDAAMAASHEETAIREAILASINPRRTVHNINPDSVAQDVKIDPERVAQVLRTYGASAANGGRRGWGLRMTTTNIERIGRPRGGSGDRAMLADRVDEVLRIVEKAKWDVLRLTTEQLRQEDRRLSGYLEYLGRISQFATEWRNRMRGGPITALQVAKIVQGIEAFSREDWTVDQYGLEQKDNVRQALQAVVAEEIFVDEAMLSEGKEGARELRAEILKRIARQDLTAQPDFNLDTFMKERGLSFADFREYMEGRQLYSLEDYQDGDVVVLDRGEGPERENRYVVGLFKKDVSPIHGDEEYVVDVPWGPISSMRYHMPLLFRRDAFLLFEAKEAATFRFDGIEERKGYRYGSPEEVAKLQADYEGDPNLVLNWYVYQEFRKAFIEANKYDDRFGALLDRAVNVASRYMTSTQNNSPIHDDLRAFMTHPLEVAYHLVRLGFSDKRVVLAALFHHVLYVVGEDQTQREGAFEAIFNELNTNEAGEEDQLITIDEFNAIRTILVERMPPKKSFAEGEVYEHTTPGGEILRVPGEYARDIQHLDIISAGLDRLDPAEAEARLDAMNDVQRLTHLAATLIKVTGFLQDSHVNESSYTKKHFQLRRETIDRFRVFLRLPVFPDILREEVSHFLDLQESRLGDVAMMTQSDLDGIRTAMETADSKTLAGFLQRLQGEQSRLLAEQPRFDPGDAQYGSAEYWRRFDDSSADHARWHTQYLRVKELADRVKSRLGPDAAMVVKKEILIIEGAENLQRLVKDTVNDMGYEATVVNDVKAALELLGARPGRFAGILTGIIKGKEGHVVQLAKQAGIPVVVMPMDVWEAGEVERLKAQSGNIRLVVEKNRLYDREAEIVGVFGPAQEESVVGEPTDAAMAAQKQTQDTRHKTQDVGGIDLNPALLDLQIKRDSYGVPLPLNQQPIMEMQIEGFLPVIINVTPIHNLPLLLGLTTEEEDTDFGYQPDIQGREVEKLSYLN